MAKWALYHDFDPFKCEVVREAIKAGAVADGEVICGDIKELAAGDVRRFRQFHAFCGGAFWSLALRQAGWPDSRPVWTGSCPCPSFSAAGKGEGFADPRHLWPEWFRLIRECRPAIVFGEQVDAAIGHGWLDAVGMDLEDEGYAVAAAVLPAASVGAPHKRNRLFFVADTTDGGRQSEPYERPASLRGMECGSTERRIKSSNNRAGAGLVVNPAQRGLGMHGSAPGSAGHAAQSGEPDFMENADSGGSQKYGLRDSSLLARRSEPGSLAHAECDGGRSDELGRGPDRGAADGRSGAVGELGQPDSGRWAEVETVPRCEPASGCLSSSPLRPSPLNGFWRDADWIGCRDGKWRPVEPGTFPLATGYPARVGLLRLAGDAICVPCAAEFIKAYIETERQ